MAGEETIISSKDTEALEHSVRHDHVEVDFELQDKPIKHFKCRELPLGKLELIEIKIDPITIYRRYEDINSDGVNNYLLSTQVKGTAVVSQDDVEYTQHPGSLAIMSAGHPYTVIHTQESHRLVLHIPSDIYHERILTHQEGRKFRPRQLPAGATSNIIFEMLKALATEGDNIQRTEQYTISECLLELASTVLRSDIDQEYEQQHTKQSALFRRILEFMEANFTDCEITPAKIAEANGISMRYLHSLFSHAGLTVSKWIWERRLKSTREDLIDPNLTHLRVSDIAFNRGFNDPAHFSRAFKSRYDVSPTQLRKIVADQQASSR